MRSSEYTGPWWPEYVTPTRSAGVLALRLQLMTVPCSVPTMNLVGPATASYSMDTAPLMLVSFLPLSTSSSTGSPSRRVSHQKTLPSVDTDTHSVPVFDCSHA